MVPAGTYSTAPAEIGAGDTASTVVDCSGTLVAIIFPDDWNIGKGLAFEISADNIDYRKLFHLDGHDVLITVQPGGAVIVPADIGRAIRFLRLVASEPQTAKRTFQAVLLSADAGTPAAASRHHK